MALRNYRSRLNKHVYLQHARTLTIHINYIVYSRTEDTGGSHPEQKERMADIDNKNNNVATQNVNSVYM